MSAAWLPAQRRPADLAALLARWVLAAFFLYLGVTKLRHPAEFLTFVQGQLHLTNPALASLFAHTAPWVEIGYGLVLLSGLAQPAAALAARWWLAGVFIYMGLNKALPHPEYFQHLVREYHIVSSPWLLNSIAAALPWFEVFCGVLLLLGIAVRGSALMLIAMLVPFSAIVLKRALEIAAAKPQPFCAIRFDCGCGAGEVFICHKLVENTVLLLLSAWLLSGAGRPLCLRFNLFREPPPNPETRDPRPEGSPNPEARKVQPAA